MAIEKTDITLSAQPDEVLPALTVLSSEGYNRAPVESCIIDARDDVAAIAAWLKGLKSPRTRRAYEKEINRFYAWLMEIQAKSLASLKLDDIAAYDAFMGDPPATWIEDRQVRTKAGERRPPFRQALSDKSRDQAITIVSACFQFLVASGYLLRNPFLVYAKSRKRDVASEAEDSRDHFISLRDFDRLIQAIDYQISVTNPKSRTKMSGLERQRFVVVFLGNTGLRREELAAAKMSDIRRHERDDGRVYWIMTVEGKGKTKRRIAINKTALDAIYRYRLHHGASQVFAGNGSALLLPLRGRNGTERFLTDQMVYYIVDAALKLATAHYSVSNPETAALLEDATPHWFRHTFATIFEQSGATPKMIQRQLGHASMQTTMSVYVGTDELELVDAAEKMDERLAQFAVRQLSQDEA